MSLSLAFSATPAAPFSMAAKIAMIAAIVVVVGGAAIGTGVYFGVAGQCQLFSSQRKRSFALPLSQWIEGKSL